MVEFIDIRAAVRLAHRDVRVAKPKTGSFMEFEYRRRHLEEGEAAADKWLRGCLRLANEARRRKSLVVDVTKQRLGRRVPGTEEVVDLCPICGKRAILLRHADGTMIQASHRIELLGNGMGYATRDACEADGTHSTYESWAELIAGAQKSNLMMA